MRKKITVAVSGGFDPLHIGHVRHLKEAKALGDKLIVFLNTDEWLKAKKGYIFMPWQERKEILESLKFVDEVVPYAENRDGTVTKTLRLFRPDIFAKGGDRTPENMPKQELEVCKELGIKIIYGVGGEKIQSSSWLVEKIKRV